MRKRLLAGLLAGFMIIQSAGTVMAAEDAASLSSTGIYETTEAAQGGASLVTSGSSEASSVSGGSEGSSESSTEASSKASSVENPDDGAGTGSCVDDPSTDFPSDSASSESASLDGSTEASSEASSGASDDDAADVASSESSFPEDYYEEHPTGFLDYDKQYELESINDLPRVNTKRLFRSAPSYPSSYITANLPGLRNQSPYGSCWAFASIGLSEINLIKNGYTGFDLSELHLAYFTYHSEVDPMGGTTGDYSTFSGSGFLDMGGNYDFAATSFMRWTGAADESLVPYSMGSTSQSSGLAANLAFNDVVHLKGYYEDVYDVNKLDPVKKMITNYGACGINFYAVNSMSGATSKNYYNQANNCYYNPNNSGANHAVIIVGWDDDFSKDNFATTPPGDGAWLIRNSWSTGSYDDKSSFNYSGYFWMSYYEGSIDEQISAFECVPVSLSHDNNYQYDGGLGIGTLGLPNSFTAAQVFTATSDAQYGEYLDEVSIWTSSAGANYTIDIYTDLTDPGNPYSGEHREDATTVGTIDFGGFYTIPLSDEIYLEEGENFAVVVKIQKSGATCNIGYEYAPHYSGYNLSTAVSAGENQSLYYNGSRWIDYGYEHGYNFRIRAYTNDLHQQPVIPTGVEFTNLVNGELSLDIGETKTVETKVLPENAARKTLIWTSSDPYIATVTQDGEVKGLFNGVATITATTVSGKVSNSFTVKVLPILESVSITSIGPRMDVGVERTFSVKQVPSNYTFRGNVTWETADPSIATVDADGKVKALKVGATNLTATVDGVSATIRIYSLVSHGSYGAEVNNDNSVRIYWEPVTGASKYIVYRGTEKIAELDTDAGFYVDRYYCDFENTGKTVNYYFAYVIGDDELESIMSAKLNARYRINYELNGGTLAEGAPTLYTKGVGAKLVDPIPPEGKGFVGWYLDDDYHQLKNEITSADTGDITLYAKYEKASVAGIDILSDDDEVHIGHSINVSANTLSNFEGYAPDEDGYTLTFSDTDAATITVSEGDKPVATITGKGFGSVTVTATAKGLGKDGEIISARKSFIVKEIRPTKMSLDVTKDTQSADISTGDTLTATAAIDPEDANQKVAWTTTNESVATVSETGDSTAKITVVGPGTAYITATSVADASLTMSHRIAVESIDDEGKELRIIDTAKVPNIYGSSSDEFDTDYSKIELAVGKSFALKAALTPNEAFTDKNVFWSSGNAAVAYVNASGKITAKSAGSAVIMARSEESGLTAACRVEVYDPVTSFALDTKSLKLGQGQSSQVNVTTILPTSASDVVTSVSNKPEIAVVKKIDTDTFEIVAGKTNGSAVISFVTEHNEKTVKLNVTVGNAVEAVDVTSKNKSTGLVLAAGKTMPFTAKVMGQDSKQAINKGVVWSVDDESVATINQKGVLTGLKYGWVTVTATCLEKNVDGEEVKSDPVEVFVYVPITKAYFNASNITLLPGGEYDLKAIFTTPYGDWPTGYDFKKTLQKEMPVSLYIASGQGVSLEQAVDAGPEERTLKVSEDCKVGQTVVIKALYRPYEKYGTQVSIKCTVKIADPSKASPKLSLSKKSLSLDRGAMTELTGSFSSVIPNDQKVTWTVEGDSVRFIDDQGNIADSIETEPDEGKTTQSVRIVAVDDGSFDKKTAKVTATTETLVKGKPLTAACMVTVLGKAAEIQLKSGKVEFGRGDRALLAKGKSMTVKASVFADADRKYKAGNQKVTWSSSNNSVATVNAAGKVVGVANGTARITATTTDMQDDKPVEKYFYVEVYNAPAKLVLDKKKASM
ncbi:MAG: Ig-like domain-containing protein, partial [Butyrivibrio sp.]|nr:Ig-like domain-containing protein [Butyrivibrio sp.]